MNFTPRPKNDRRLDRCRHPPSRFLSAPDHPDAGWSMSPFIRGQPRRGTVHTFSNLVLSLATLLGSAACAAGNGHAPGRHQGARRQRAEVDRVLGNGQVVPVRPGPESRRCRGRRSTSAASRRASTTTRPPRACRWRAARLSSRAACGPRQSSSVRSRSSAAPTPGTWRRRLAPRPTPRPRRSRRSRPSRSGRWRSGRRRMAS